MTKEQQREFIGEMIDSVKGSLLAKFDKKGVPEHWDGIELRWWIAETFGNVVIGYKQELKKRKAQYNNTVLVNDL